MTAVCKAPGCCNTTLCDAHIRPKGFGRGMSKPGGHNLAVRADGAKLAKQPLGPFDSQILCAACDGKLGILDEYAVTFCRMLPETPASLVGRALVHQPFDGDIFARAMLAIFWRASISARPEWEDVHLGPYERRAAEILFKDIPLSSLAGFSVVLARYASDQVDCRKFQLGPYRDRVGPLNVLKLSLGGFKIVAKFDARPFAFPLNIVAINGRDRLFAPYMRFEETDAFEWFRKPVSADRRRAAARNSRG